MNGIDHITQALSAARDENRAALMPYFTLGYPSEQKSLEVIENIARSGADLIELGVPFSDPLADGPTIQRSTQVALENGITVARCLELTRSLRKHGVEQPLLLMGYYNPILAYGIQKYVVEAAEAGADGFIVPDLPPDEARQMETACSAYGMALVFLLAPTSTAQRIKEVADHSTGFVYLVSVTGVTGARESLSGGLADFVNRVRIATDKPLAVGFGITTPEQAQEVGDMVEGVIVGSALINAVDSADDSVTAAGKFTAKLRSGLVRTN